MMKNAFDVGAIVQVPVHGVDTMKVNDKILTLVVMDIAQKKDKSCAMY